MPTDQCLGTIRRAVSKLEETLTEEIGKLAEIGKTLILPNQYCDSKRLSLQLASLLRLNQIIIILVILVVIWFGLLAYCT